ncbi:MAG: tRNA (adenosine(37)-N6)-threonylcarbamoyltransferase complex ATPase subunit type 1 TsaE [Planctomycetia bacterium]|nr:tRNA (adenosine(37)-N6)-threonylcarbamoyltransferase complex ATPase subunit type 1 TsaE [Planctomycetia bacterium]
MSTNAAGRTVDVIAQCLEETLSLGRRIGQFAHGGQCIAIEGMLGTGKTQLVRGICLGAQIADVSLVNSPSYVLLNVYDAMPENPKSKTVFHLDAYRVNNSSDFVAVGLPEILEQDGIVAIEWASRVTDLLPDDYLLIQGETLDESARRWRITALGPNTEYLLKAITRTDFSGTTLESTAKRQ